MPHRASRYRHGYRHRDTASSDGFAAARCDSARHGSDEAAAAAGTSRATIARRLRVPEVRRALDSERQRVAAEVSDRLCGAMPAIVARLHHIATESESERETINASRVLLSEARAWRDHRWLTERLEAVEDALARQRGVS